MPQSQDFSFLNELINTPEEQAYQGQLDMVQEQLVAAGELAAGLATSTYSGLLESAGSLFGLLVGAAENKGTEGSVERSKEFGKFVRKYTQYSPQTKLAKEGTKKALTPLAPLGKSFKAAKKELSDIHPLIGQAAFPLLDMLGVAGAGKLLKVGKASKAAKPVDEVLEAKISGTPQKKSAPNLKGQIGPEHAIEYLKDIRRNKANTGMAYVWDEAKAAGIDFSVKYDHPTLKKASEGSAKTFGKAVTVPGAYAPKANKLFISTKHLRSFDELDSVLTHEAIHGIIHQNMTPMGKEYLRGELSHFVASLEPHLKTAPKSVQRRLGAVLKGNYSVDELVTYSMSNNQFAKWLGSIEGVPGTSKIGEPGYWTNLKGIMLKSLDASGTKLPTNNQLNDLSHLLDQAFEFRGKAVKGDLPKKPDALFIPAEKAPIDAQSKADKLFREGWDADEVTRQTGISPFGKEWRYELDDTAAKIDIDRLNDVYWNDPGGVTNLKNVLDYEELYKAYPALKETKVSFEELPGSTSGSFTPSGQSGRIAIKPADNLEAFRRTFLHEVQHATQYQAGETFRRIVPNSETELKLLENLGKFIDRTQPQRVRRKFTEQYKTYKEKREAFVTATKMDDLPDDIFDIVYDEYHTAIDGIQKDFKYQLYQMSPWETEAFEVGRRTFMGSEQRRKSVPYTRTDNPTPDEMLDFSFLIN